MFEYALYLQQCQLEDGRWIDLGYWQMYPRYFRDFLAYIFSWSSYRDEESQNITRFKRVTWDYGLASFEFHGDGHTSLEGKQ